MPNPVNPVNPGTGNIPFTGPKPPIMVAGGTPTVPTTPAMSGATSISSGLSLKDGSNTLVGDFKDTYGSGTGTALAGVLGNLGTATDGAVSATNAAIEADAAKSYANIASGEAASGVTANSSTAALAQGDFAAGLANTIASTDAGMELSEQNTLIQALQGEGAAHGSDTSGWDTFASVLSGGTSALSAIGGLAGNVSEAAGASGSAASILDGIAMFA